MFELKANCNNCMILFTENGCSLSLYSYKLTAFVRWISTVAYFFACVNKIEAMYKRSRVNIKVLVQPLRLQATLHTLPLFYLRARAHAG